MSEKEHIVGSPKNYTNHPDYKFLPEPLKAKYSPKEYAWLPDSVRARLLEIECYPEVEED